MASKRLTVKQKKEIFKALVDLQDARTMPVGDSIDEVCRKFKITENQLEKIQEEGIAREWPPLEQAV
jgi:hypothetical protein